MSALTIVIKYGGHAMDKPELASAFAEGLTALSAKGMRLAVVHGGGPQINSLLNRLSIESRFESGLRVTDEDTMQAVEMVLCGQVNKAVVTQFEQHGIRAVGISGKDAHLLQASQISPMFGLVGEVKKVDPAVVDTLMNGGFLPVIAPVATSERGESLNINADTAAGAIAGALKADYFVLVSDVPGVLDKNGSLLPSINSKQIAELKADGTIHSGMIPKTASCLNALRAGCARALILDGRAPKSLERYLLNNEPLGTIVEP